MALQIIDKAVEWVATHPERFFRGGSPNGLELAQAVWIDATLSGIPDVLIHHKEDVWVVAATANWFTHETYSVTDLFKRIVPHAAAGPNSMRSEVLLNAFCTDVVAVTAEVSIFTKGAGSTRTLLDQVLQHWAGLNTAVAFQM